MFCVLFVYACWEHVFVLCVCENMFCLHVREHCFMFCLCVHA